MATDPVSAPPRRGRGRPSLRSLQAAAQVDESLTASSINTPADSPEGYATPATTTSPPNDDLDDIKPSSSRIEVRLPSRRTSQNFESNDDDFENDPSLQLARELQKQEEDELMSEPVAPPKRRRSTRGAGPLEEADFPTPVIAETSKRSRGAPRSSTGPPPRKRTRTEIPDSESSEAALAEKAWTALDEEIAAGAAQGYSSDLSSVHSDILEESEGIYSESDEEPLSASRARSKGKGKAVAKGKAPAKAKPTPQSISIGGARLSRGKAKEELVELDDDDLKTEDEYLDDEDDDVADFLDEASVASDSEAQDEGADDEGVHRAARQRRAYRRPQNKKRVKGDRARLEAQHPMIKTMWDDLEAMPVLKAGKADQPKNISRQLKPFQLEGLAWMVEMEKTEWKGGLLGDEMGLGKTIQAVSLIMSDYPAKQPSLVLVPPVALMQWQSEIKSYTDGTLKTFVFHGTNQKTKGITIKELKKYDVIMMSYNSLESMYRKQEKGFKRKAGLHLEDSVIHAIDFHRIILDEAHSIKTRSTMTAKACFALKTNYRWCLSGTPLQNRIGEFFSLIRFLNIQPFAQYLCKQCPCAQLEWGMDEGHRCKHCNHHGMQHVSVFNQELLNPIQKHGNTGPGKEAFKKLRLMTDRMMLRRLKKDHTNAMELPTKEIFVDRQFFGEEENDFANSIMTNGQRKFDTYVAQGVLLNNYANVFGLIMQMRQVADHPDLILRKNADGGQNVIVCCICDEPAEDTIRSRCKHDFCRACVASYVRSTDEPDCPRCHIPLAIDLEQPEIEQDESLMKKSSIINRIKMENWTSSSKIELLVHELYQLRSDNASHKSIIFSQFTTMLQLIEWRLRRAGITTVMLDGTMTPAQRQASIEHFMTNVDTECFLVSLKAGGVALNLTEASRVFIVDPWWNPAAEWQSADRCHRIGQTRPCTITRLCIEDSVESRMVLIQEKKANMIHSTVNNDDKAMDSLSPEDMQFLFRGT